MIALILLCGGIGVALIVTSLPPLRSPGLARRVEPFLDGLRGRQSRLLLRPSSVRSPWLASVVARVGLAGHGDIKQRLTAAGRPPDEVAFRVEQAAWGGVTCAATIATTVVLATSGVMPATPTLGIVAALTAVIGALGRDWYLTKQIERRRNALKDELPTAIDHLTLSLLAGDSVPAAFARIAQDARGVVGTEFGRVVAEIRGGATVVEALEDLRARMPDTAIARFVDALCTAVERGTSLSDVLRAQADDVRDARRRHLMELGGRREVLMLIPVVFLIMPVVVLFALYPGLVSLDLLVP